MFIGVTNTTQVYEKIIAGYIYSYCSQECADAEKQKYQKRLHH
jgi:hypothetical protein